MARRKRKQTPRVVGLKTGEGYSCHGPVNPSRDVLDGLKAAGKAIRKSGLRIPEMRVTFWRSIICDRDECAGLCVSRTGRPYEILLRESDTWAETLVHEVAHAVADGSVRVGFSAHSQVWAAIYGLLYQAVIQR